MSDEKRAKIIIAIAELESILDCKVKCLTITADDGAKIHILNDDPAHPLGTIL